MEVDFTPLLEIAVSLVVLLAGWGIKRVASSLGLDIDDKQRMALESMIEKGVGYATKRMTGPDGQISFELESEFVAKVADYVADSVPGALKHFKVDPRTPEGRAKLERMIEARMGLSEVET
jgi:hypothetical protein